MFFLGGFTFLNKIMDLSEETLRKGVFILNIVLVRIDVVQLQKWEGKMI